MQSIKRRAPSKDVSPRPGKKPRTVARPELPPDCWLNVIRFVPSSWWDTEALGPLMLVCKRFSAAVWELRNEHIQALHRKVLELGGERACKSCIKTAYLNHVPYADGVFVTGILHVVTVILIAGAFCGCGAHEDEIMPKACTKGMVLDAEIDYPLCKVVKYCAGQGWPNPGVKLVEIQWLRFYRVSRTSGERVRDQILLVFDNHDADKSNLVFKRLRHILTTLRLPALFYAGTPYKNRRICDLPKALPYCVTGGARTLKIWKQVSSDALSKASN